MRPDADHWKVVAQHPACVDEAARWAERAGGTVLVVPGELANAKPKDMARFLQEALGTGASRVLFCDGSGLSIFFYAEVPMFLRADFHGPEVSFRRSRGGGRGQMIARAVGLKSGRSPSVLDATAGLGADAFVLASLGCPVRLIERSVPLCFLVESAMERAACEEDAELNAVLDRMHLDMADALEVLRTLEDEERPDVVYLDPMFPPRSKSALVKKEMRLVHQLVGEDTDSGELLEAALPVARDRVVVKRPRIAPDLIGPEPDVRLTGKSNRYDIYLVKQQNRTEV
ncbi:MAG: class I SAM-dependent methyltransferase [Coraliomargaritaceae bacterium]